MANQLMISWSNRSSPRIIKVYLEGCYGYQNDHKARFSSFPVKMSHLDDVMTKLWRHKWKISLVEFIFGVTVSFIDIRQ